MEQNIITPLKDTISEARLNLLHPKAIPVFRAFIEEIEAAFNVTIRIVQGLRTFAEQDAIYAQGRTTAGKIVTNAKPGSSFHNYGTAIDIAVLPATGGIDWNYDYKKFLPLAEKYGLEWGGNFHSIPDKPHFQLTFGYTWQELLGKVNNKEVDGAGYVII